MALFLLPFGHAEWRTDEAPARSAALERPARPARLELRVPAALEERIEAAASREGLTVDAWARRALSRSLDPRFGA